VAFQRFTMANTGYGCVPLGPPLLSRNGTVSRPHASSLAIVFLVGLTAPVRAQAPAAPPPNVVFVADGAGNYQMASKMLRSAVGETGAPLDVETFVWSHGYKKVLPDQVDFAHARMQGEHLADAVLALCKQHPDARIHLVGHSAGSMVVLSAAEHLPADAVASIVLLGPSVSCEYDIRPALRCARCGLEVHYSSRDWLYLGLCTGLVGCADRRRCGASGRCGFSLLVESPDDEQLLERLHQHAWQPDDRQLGNHGGHYGAYQVEYLKARVLPVLLKSVGGEQRAVGSLPPAQ
jgi:pimeloyl-ACP methyl ester carboxylesterase